MGDTIVERLKRAGSQRNGAAAPPAAAPRPEPYQPMPLDLLPLPLLQLVEEASLALGCDPTFIALPALAVAAGAIGNSRAVRLKRTWIEPSILWTCVVGDSGTLKTPAYRIAMYPLYNWQREARRRHRLELSRWEEQREAWRESKGRAKERGSEAPPEPDKPAMRRAYCSDVTIEKLAEVLEDNPRGVLVARDELRGWLGSFARYKAQAGSSDLPNWLEMYQAGAIAYDRKGGERRLVLVERASTSVTGGIQPGTLARVLTGEHFESGLVARLLLAWPPRRPKRWSEADIDPATEERYRLLLDKLLALTMRQTSDRGHVPHRLLLAPEARRLWVNFYDEWADVQAQAEGELAACYSKIEGVAPRLALLHHVVTLADLDSDDQRDIGTVSMEAGIGLARWFAAEAARVYAMLAETEEQGRSRRLVEWVESRGGEVTARDLWKGNTRRYPDTGAARAALDTLAQAGHGTWQDRPAGERGGRPTQYFVLVPHNPITPKPPPGEVCEATPKPPETPSSSLEDTIF